MKANEAPERLYLSKTIYSTFIYQVPDPDDESAVEYMQTNILVDKGCAKLKKLMYDNPMFQGSEEVIENFVAEFRKYMEEELWT